MKTAPKQNLGEKWSMTSKRLKSTVLDVKISLPYDVFAKSILSCHHIIRKQIFGPTALLIPYSNAIMYHFSLTVSI